jgi:hypothetical protein
MHYDQNVLIKLLCILRIQMLAVHFVVVSLVSPFTFQVALAHSNLQSNDLMILS